MHVLQVAPAFHPATYWGGPMVSMRALCDGLAAAPGVTLEVLSTDSAGPDPADRLRPATDPDRFPAGYDVHYARRVAGHAVSPDLLYRLVPMMARADLVHLAGTYSFTTLPVLALARALARPVVWSPRGEILASVAWQGARRRGAKRAFERTAAALAPRRTLLHVTSAGEGAACARRLPGIGQVLVPNIVETPEPDPATGRDWRPGGALRLLYLSRLHPKKGLEMLLAALADLPGHVTLEICGTGEPAYRARLEREARRLGLAGRVAFRGHVAGPAKRAAFARADLFVLPTHSENFGVAVAEALAHGVPVVTTTGAPWAELERQDCGAWVAPEPGALRAAILRLAGRDLAAMGRRGRAWMVRAFGAEEATARLLAAYRALIAGDRSGTVPAAREATRNE